MGEWHSTSCPLCAQNCGLRVCIEDQRIVQVKGDQANPRSRGYACRKGLKLAYYQHHAQRLAYPLRRVGTGFQRVSWEEAVGEIGADLRRIVDDHGPRAFAYLGGGGQGGHFEAAFGISLMKALGSRYHYSALAQELTGFFWCAGRLFGRQNRFPIPDEAHADMLLAIGWNGAVSHQAPRAPLMLREFSKNRDKRLVVIDPRRSETARLADLHLPLRPGTDALLARAMIALILAEGWEDREYLAQHTTGFSAIRPWFDGFDVASALEVCELEVEAVRALCRELSRRSWCMHFDLGVYMNRHSTLSTYLYLLLSLVCGRCCLPGGNVLPGSLVPLGEHSDERDPRTWRTMATKFPAITGVFPPNVLPAEILDDGPERVRALITSWANPLRSYADTPAYERAFRRLELSVTIDVAMSETAERSQWVLPARSALESWDGTFFTWNFPEIFFQFRRPVLEPLGEAREGGEIMTQIAEAAGLLPSIPPALRRAAGEDRLSFTAALLSFALRNKQLLNLMPHLLGRTLGEAWGSVHRAALYGALLAAPGTTRRAAARAGLTCPSLADRLWDRKRLFRAVAGVVRHRSLAPLALLTERVAHAERIFDAIMDHPEGLWVGQVDGQRNFDMVRTASGKIEMHVPEMESWLAEVTPEQERAALTLDPEFPLVLNAGRHKPENANTIMRDPAWNGSRRACTVALAPADAAALGITDGQQVRVVTANGQIDLEAEVTESVRPGQVLVPHGFGLKYQGRVYGANVNALTSAGHRDRLAATPLHRFVPCRIEALHR